MNRYAKGLLGTAIVLSLIALYFTIQGPSQLLKDNIPAYELPPKQIADTYFPLMANMLVITGLLLFTMLYKITTEKPGTSQNLKLQNPKA